MKLTESLALALKNIRSSKMRTFLTMLGIIIGVSAVIVITGLGNGMQKYMEDSFAELGTNSLSVTIMGRGSSRSVSEEQMYAIVEDNPEYFEAISPLISMSGVKIGTESLSSTSATGVSEDYFDMKSYTIAQGRGIEYVDVSARKRVCVVGEYLNKTYFNGSAVGQTLKINGNKFRIVGVMTQEGDDLEKGGTDDCVFVPYSTAARLSYTGTIASYTVTAPSKDLASPAKSLLQNKLYDIFQDEDAYSVISMSEILDMMNSMINVMITILAAIAAISLVVGGIGIMNIMLVSVTERTREIGIRKALGAKERYIMQQFVIEAATTSVLGGLFGIAGGYIGTLIVCKVSFGTFMFPSAGITLGAAAISVILGIIFGMYPAIKASGLQPVEALRAD